VVTDLAQKYGVRTLIGRYFVDNVFNQTVEEDVETSSHLSYMSQAVDYCVAPRS